MTDFLPAKRFTNSARVRLPAKVNMTMVNKVVPWVESFWHANKRFPADTEFLTHFNFGGVTVSEVGGKTEIELLRKLKFTKQFKGALLARGISYDPLSSSGGSYGDLSSEQVATISVLTNFADTRPQGIKLHALGISAEQVSGWMSQPSFQRELTARADEQFNNIYPQAVSALGKAINRQNVPAIKFYFEATGRAKSPAEINLRLAMQHLIESVQRHVEDPMVLARIAEDFRSIQALNATQSSSDDEGGVA